MRPTSSLIEPEVSERQKLIREIQALLLEKLSIRVDSPHLDLLQAGILDSVAQVQLLLHLEKHFGLHLPMETLEVDSLLSVVKIAELVAHCTRAQSGWPGSEVPGAAGNGGLASLPPTERLEQHNLILEIQALLLQHLSIRVEDIKADLFQTGAFDSMTLVQFILYLETHFGLHLPMEDLEIDSFRSVVKIAETVTNRASQTALSNNRQ